MANPSNAFKPIREAAEAADALESDDEDLVEGAQRAEGDPIEEIESLCMECHENGTTRLMLSLIPFFKEVIIMSFRCPHCGFHNSEIQSAGQVQELGSTYTVKVTSRLDLNRQLVKSEYATLQIPEYELTLPPGKGQLTTIESVISHTIEDLEFEQPARQHIDPPTYAKIEALLDKLRPIVAEKADGAKEEEMLEKSFTVKLDDPSGGSFIEAKGGFDDPKWSKKEFKRTKEQNEYLGLAKALTGEENSQSVADLPPPVPVNGHSAKAAQADPTTLTDDYVESKPEDVYSFPDVCTSCGATLETYMKTVNIPHFKEVVLMSTNCHSCGYRDNEIKSGGAIADKGKKITLKVEDSDDLSRDILKSETAGLSIPEIELHLQPGTLGGRFTTLEGLLQQVYEELDEKVFAGDSAAKSSSSPSSTSTPSSSPMETFLKNLKSAMEVQSPFSIILDDPLSNSYIQNIYAPDEDPNMVIEEYERDHEQNEELGLNDIVVEGYHGEEEARKAREEDDAAQEKAKA